MFGITSEITNITYQHKIIIDCYTRKDIWQEPKISSKMSHVLFVLFFEALQNFFRHRVMII